MCPAAEVADEGGHRLQREVVAEGGCRHDSTQVVVHLTPHLDTRVECTLLCTCTDSHLDSLCLAQDPLSAKIIHTFQYIFHISS